ncbi:hypothetical protein [Streptomyces sp. NPDC059928]|uniref:hypothetical protein n=1 Tax=unclassified Streptomyces TaxID=2593676 RepID=UPI00366521FC
MKPIQYRCGVRAALRVGGRGTATLINSHGTPSVALAVSWLRAQVMWCAGQLGDDASSRQLQAWLRDDTAQWALFAALMAGENTHVQVCRGATTVELHAGRGS